MAVPRPFVDFLAHLRIGLNYLPDLNDSTSLGEETINGFAEDLSDLGLVELDGRKLTVKPGGRVLAGRYLLQRGVSVEELSRVLDWREFEDLVSKSLEAQGYSTWRNYRMRKPTREIDVVGVYSGFAIAFDCKHWQRASISSLSLAATKQIQRTQQLVSSGAIPEIEAALPALVVLGPFQRASVGRVPLVHADGLVDFIMGARGHSSEFVTVRPTRRRAEATRGTQRHL
jgi:hypothetical protein